MSKRTARVLFLNDTARNGGPGRSLFYILKFLDPKVIHRTVMLPRPGVISRLYEENGVADDLLFLPDMVENPIEPWDRPIEREDFERSNVVKGVRLAGNIARVTRGLARLERTIRARKIDLLYCNGTNADFAGGALARLAKTPALWHVRYTSVPPAVNALHTWLARASNVRRIVCVSHASAALFPGSEHKTRVVHNALDTAEFDATHIKGKLRDELGLAPDAVVFGSQGRVLPKKGYIELIDAAKACLDALTEEERKRAVFVVVGDTPADLVPDHLAECRAHVAALGLGEKVRFIGFREDVKPYVVDFDVAIVPSVYPDPLPRAVIECMAMGKPVVAFDVGGVGEMLRDGSTGILLGPRDVAGMAKAFVRYMREPSLRSTHGEAARARILAEFDAGAHALKISEQILEAVNS